MGVRPETQPGGRSVGLGKTVHFAALPAKGAHDAHPRQGVAGDRAQIGLRAKHAFVERVDFGEDPAEHHEQDWKGQ